jgi:hypothetical protein
MITASIESMQAIRIAFLAAVCLYRVLADTGLQESRGQERIDEALRRESDALVAIADDAVDGRSVPADFLLEWRNDFFKAQPGTFVPFTVSFTAPASASRLAFLYVRIERRPRPKGSLRNFAYETIFPVKVEARTGEEVSLTRGFAVPPGRYRAVLVLRESSGEQGESRPRKAGVLLQELDVPDFWTGELATSTLMLATRVERLSAPVPADELDEDPYAVGTNRIHVTRERAFTRSQELIVAFLIYNPSVGPDKQFDVQVDYHLYKKEEGGQGAGGHPDHPPARPGERYVTRTNPQRFNPSMMGAQFNPLDGTPVLAGQGILLSEFSPGEYRLGITVTDLQSRKSLTREVMFKVTGSYDGGRGAKPLGSGRTRAQRAPRERSEPAQRLARERVGESEGRSPSVENGGVHGTPR